MKTITKVFLAIATLVIVLVAWDIVFNDGGIIQSGWNSVANYVNNLWFGITGSRAEIVPTMGTNLADTDFNSRKDLDDAEDIGDGTHSR